jgi:hypothetical protein
MQLCMQYLEAPSTPGLSFIPLLDDRLDGALAQRHEVIPIPWHRPSACKRSPSVSNEWKHPADTCCSFAQCSIYRCQRHAQRK